MVTETKSKKKDREELPISFFSLSSTTSTEMIHFEGLTQVFFVINLISTFWLQLFFVVVVVSFYQIQ
jgi:hypothetical protein